MYRLCCGILVFFMGLSPPELLGQAKVGGNLAPDGAEVMIDLPTRERVKNRGGSDEAGLCVFASTKHSAVWQNVVPLIGIFEWMFDKPGGGWPQKLDAVIARICQEKRVGIPGYLNYQGKDFSLVKAAIESGRMVGVTYHWSPSGRYRGQRIAHMVNVVHYSGDWVGILDNNFPGEIEWITVRDFQQVSTGGTGGNFWAVVFAAPGPPPVPRNKERRLSP